MNKIEATFRIVTPMFIGGANQTPDDGIRPPSVKGALRFWWRALNWGEFYKHEKNEAKALQNLHDEEARLFGSAADEHGGGGQGCFLVRVIHGPLKRTDAPTIHPKLKNYTAARYLGYGLMVAFRSMNRDTGVTKEAGQLERGCLNEDQEFTVELIFRRAIEPSVKKALIAWGLLGGLGSRSRHGMGSIALLTLKDEEVTEPWIAPENIDGYDSKIKDLFPSTSLPSHEPPFSAFWQESRIDRLLSAASSYQVLDDFGNRMLDYRSWGKSDRGNVLPSGKVSEKRFDKDHHWYKKPQNWSEASNFHPERVEFGLPHNYHPKHHHVISENYERRSSPLLFHVHLIGNQFIGVGIYMPAQFLPKGEKIKANGKLVPASIGWSVIIQFLDGKVGNPPTAKDRFPSPEKKAVLP